MRPCFNEVTTLRTGSLEQDLKLCAEVGFRDMELREEKFYGYLRSGHRISDVRALFEYYGIRPICFNAQHGIGFRRGLDKRAMRKLTEMYCASLSEIGIRDIELIAANDVTGPEPGDIHREMVETLRGLSDIAGYYGIRLAVEYMGVASNSVNTFLQTLAIVDEVDRSNIGILVDTWHHYNSGSAPEDFRKADPKRIFTLHISDGYAAAPLTAPRADCIWPGDGAIPLIPMLQNLQQAGYDDVASVEIFSPEIQASPLEENIRTAYRRTVDILAQAGVLDAGVVYAG